MLAVPVGIEEGAQRLRCAVGRELALNRGAVGRRQVGIVGADQEAAVERSARPEQVGVVGRLGDQVLRVGFREPAFREDVDVLIDFEVPQKIGVDTLLRRQQVTEL